MSPSLRWGRSTRICSKRRVRVSTRLAPRMFGAGLLLILASWLLGTRSYLGLGVPTILRAFHDATLPGYAFLAKLGFTALTLSAGFLGGEGAGAGVDRKARKGATAPAFR